MEKLDRLVLVLNKVWVPIRTIRLKRMLKLVFSNRAFIIDTDNFSVLEWEEWISTPVKEEDDGIRTTRGKIKIPEVIVLSRYDKVNNNKIRLTKKNIFLRDNSVCQYSGEKLKKSECDIDHVVPKAKGGKNSWENMVVCSKKINRKKGDKFLNEVGLKLIRKPFAPTTRNLFLNTNEMPKSWLNFIEGANE